MREDLRDLSKISDLSQVEMLASLLPSKVGNPLSVQSLREDIETSHETVTRWLKYLNELYYFFELRPWNKSIQRSLKKERKIYLYDWTEVESPGFRFENLVALHLLKACQYWTDTGCGIFDLFYLRNKDQEEIDFLIVKDKKPWLTVEAKLSDTNIDRKAANRFTKALGCAHVQVVLDPDVWLKTEDGILMSAGYLFRGLP